jgi:hypothetical protein
MARVSAQFVCGMFLVLCWNLAAHAQCAEPESQFLQCTGNGTTCYISYTTCVGTSGPDYCYALNPVFCSCNRNEGALNEMTELCGAVIPEAGDVTSSPTVAQVFMRDPFGKWYPVDYVMFKRDGEHGSCPASSVLLRSRNRRRARANAGNVGGGL